MSTYETLVETAANLLDCGGEAAVTLRAVGKGAGLSHNAPYKHFESRDALLAAVAAADLDNLTASFAELRKTDQAPKDMLMKAIGALVTFGRERPARYRLVFSVPALARNHSDLQKKSTACVEQVMAMVVECQRDFQLPDASAKGLTSLFLATMHGLVSMEANGVLSKEKGLPSIEEGLDLMFELFSR